ncbi:hypothetical protein MC885_016308 [Smutsia gigantea]|nr:hypothetical protein MC885_016308 [Smutsia gigantea]
MGERNWSPPIHFLSLVLFSSLLPSPKLMFVRDVVYQQTMFFYCL